MTYVAEGLPGAGKTTVLAALANPGHVMVVRELLTREPPDAELAWYLANDADKDALARADSTPVVLMDRSYLSTLAYRYALQQREGGDPYDQALAAVTQRLAAGTLHVPDGYLYFRHSPASSLARQSEANASQWRSEQFLKAVQDFYDYHLGNELRGLVLHIDATRPLRQVIEQVGEHLSTYSLKSGIVGVRNQGPSQWGDRHE